MLSPHLALVIGHDRQHELIAEADKQRQLAAAKRLPAARRNGRGTSRPRFRFRAGDTLVRWVDRVPVPPR